MSRTCSQRVGVVEAGILNTTGFHVRICSQPFHSASNNMRPGAGEAGSHENPPPCKIRPGQGPIQSPKGMKKELVRLVYFLWKGLFAEFETY